MKLLKVDVPISTAYHLQSDRSTERVNQTLERYLRNYCSNQQDDWFDLLPMVEHVYNWTSANSSKVSPYYANYGYQPEISWLTPKRKWNNIDPISEILDDPVERNMGRNEEQPFQSLGETKELV